MKLVCISDTHGTHARLNMPAGDVLIHAGDFSTHGTFKELENFGAWMRAQPYKHKILVAGNHDMSLAATPACFPSAYLDGIAYLCDGGVVIDGVSFWGSPWTPRFGNWSFMKQRHGQELRDVWDAIPDGTDVLVTHGPSHGTLDKNDQSFSCGCELLHERLLVVRPGVHIFGHIHESPGVVQRSFGARVSVNASMLDYRASMLDCRWPVREPIVLDTKDLGIGYGR